MSKSLIAFISILSCCAIAIFYDGGVAAEKPTKPAIDGEMTFGDKIVVLFTERTAGIESAGSTVSMTNAKIAIMGDRYFIRGTAVGIRKEEAKDEAKYERYKWYDGIEMAIDWKSVYHIYVLTSEQYDGYIKADKADREEEE